jgi:hypothetical protein
VSDIGVLTIVPGGTEKDQRFRNDVAEMEGRLRFILNGFGFNPVFGGEPMHPGDRVVSSLSLARLHLHHIVDAGASVLVLVLVGEVDADMTSAIVRYLDARVDPPPPIFLLGVEEMGFRPEPVVMRTSGELKALGRAHATGVGAVKKEDARFYAFFEGVEKARDDAVKVPREARFRDDLRRHHHLAVCPTSRAPLSWRLPPLHALAEHGITCGFVDPEEIRARVRWLLGAAIRPADPRLVEIMAKAPGVRPGDLATHAVAIAIRDLADEKLAFTVTLGTALPGAVSPERVASLLGAPEDPAGGVATPLCVSTQDDDAGAISQYLLQRASAGAVVQKYRDPQHVRPSDSAATFRIAGLTDGRVVLSIPAALAGSALVRSLASGPVTGARVAFSSGSATAAVFESREPPAVQGSELHVALAAPASSLFAQWPTDRVALIPGRHADRLVSLASQARFAPRPLVP